MKLFEYICITSIIILSLIIMLAHVSDHNVFESTITKEKIQYTNQINILMTDSEREKIAIQICKRSYYTDIQKNTFSNGIFAISPENYINQCVYRLLD